jgi:hypothetical protein
VSLVVSLVVNTATSGFSCNDFLSLQLGIGIDMLTEFCIIFDLELAILDLLLG